MRKLNSNDLTDSVYSTGSEFVSHGQGEDLTIEIKKDFEIHGKVPKFFYFWIGLLAKLGWLLTREEILEIATGKASLMGPTDGEMGKNSLEPFYRVWTRKKTENEIDLEPGCKITSVKVGKQAHYVVKDEDGVIQGWLPARSVMCIDQVTGIAGVSEPHDREEEA